MQMTSAMPALAAGVHHVRYANAHRPDVGVYLANALVPASARVAITDQLRDVDQRSLDVMYVLHAETGGPRGRTLVLIVATVAIALALGAFALMFTNGR
jgi:hypothetical protein